VAKTRRKPNIALVAQRARVAKSTVSRVLNGGYASAEVRSRVLKVIQKLDYTPWSTARNFSLGRAGCFGLVVEDSLGEWLPQILAGIEDEIGALHISLLLSSTMRNDQYDPGTVRLWIRERRVDGLIFARAGRRESELIAVAEQQGVAVVLIAPDVEYPGVRTLRSRNREAGQAIARYLLDLGHEQIAYVGGPEHSIDTRERLKGLQEGLADRGASLAESNIRFSPSYHAQGGAAYAARWLKLVRRKAPTAIVLANDPLALGFLRTVQAAGVRVPKDVSVVGFDDISSAALFYPALTTARQRLHEIGAAAGRSLIRQLEVPGAKLKPLDFPIELVERESTGQAPTRR
jgi:DNA-binding LacI/PurR family transcriptional regulator